MFSSAVAVPWKVTSRGAPRLPAFLLVTNFALDQVSLSPIPLLSEGLYSIGLLPSINYNVSLLINTSGNPR